MSMLVGLAGYGSGSNSEEPSPAPGGDAPSAAPDAAPGPAPSADAASGPRLLSIVDYGAEPDEEELAARRRSAQRVGVSLDEDELDRATRRVAPCDWRLYELAQARTRELLDAWRAVGGRGGGGASPQR